MTAWRDVQRVVRGIATSDGAGVRLMRTLGSPLLDHLDPFLLLDEFRSDDPNDYIAGFPDHPHRGFETVTYMLAGRFQHRDHKGNRGDLEAGSVQWMTAGRGIVHSEMPLQESGLVWGFQLWVNLPASDKMCEPRYQDIPASDIPTVERDGGISVRVIAGTVDGVEGPVREIVTRPSYLDVSVPPGQIVELDVPTGRSAFCYPFEGEGDFGRDEVTVTRGNLVVLGDGDGLRVAASDDGVRFLLVAAQPIGEPVARYGPFVMNTREELIQAFADFDSGALQR